MRSTPVTTVVAFTVLLLAALTPRAVQAQCMKWNNGLSDCAAPGDGGLANLEWCMGQSLLPLSPANDEVLQNRRYADTPEEVCQEWKQYGYPTSSEPLGVDFLGGDPAQTRCWLDAAPIGTWDGEISTVVEFLPRPRESCCDAIVQGPHSVPPDEDISYVQPGGSGTAVFEQGPVQGGKFTYMDLTDGSQTYLSQIRLIRGPNLIRPSRYAYLSDLARPGAEELFKFERFNGQLNNLPWLKKKYGPQVDHIVPRVDKYGCACGSNSFNNAHVISAELNNDLSNNCEDPRRKAIIEFYSVSPSPFAAIVAEGGWSTALRAIAQHIFIQLSRPVVAWRESQESESGSVP